MELQEFLSLKFLNIPINECPTNEIDGFVNLIFNESISKEDVKKHSFGIDEAILFGLLSKFKDNKKFTL